MDDDDDDDDEDDDDNNNNLSRQYVFPSMCLLTQGFLQYPTHIPYNGYSLHGLSQVTCSVNIMSLITSTDLWDRVPLVHMGCRGAILPNNFNKN